MEATNQSEITVMFPTNISSRARRVVTRSRARSTGKYPSWKMGRMIEWESENELNAFRLLDVNPAVRSFREQPCEIRYVLHGELHRHYPDALVELDTGNELWEIKPEREAIAQDTVDRTQLLSGALPNHGFRYRVAIAEDLRREPRLTNAKILLRHGRSEISPLDRERVRLALLPTGYVTWGFVLNGALGYQGRSHICRLALEGLLAFDFEQPLVEATRFYWVANR